MKKQLDNVRHDYVRYANCWEDADVLLEGLAGDSGQKILSVGSAGDNSFSLLTLKPELLVAVDINPVQLHLIALKKAAFQTLNHTEFLGFLGFAKSNDRLSIFQNKIAQILPSENLRFWNFHHDHISEGVIYGGKFENYFYLFRKKVLPLVHSRKRVIRLLANKEDLAQKHFFEKTWNSFRWRLLFRLFFSRFVMGRLGRDPEFLKEVDISVSKFILDSAAEELSASKCQSNYMLNMIMNGHFGEHLPHYARKENFEIIKSQIDKFELHQGLAEDAFQKFGKFDLFNLSNIFEYMNLSLFGEVGYNLIENGNPGAKYAYWNLMVNRQMSTLTPVLSKNEELSVNLTEKDCGFFYSSFNLDQKA